MKSYLKADIEKMNAFQITKLVKKLSEKRLNKEQIIELDYCLQRIPSIPEAELFQVKEKLTYLLENGTNMLWFKINTPDSQFVKDLNLALEHIPN